MSLLLKSCVAALTVALVACGPVEIRVSKAQGVRPLNGTLVASINTSGTNQFMCGDSIIATDSEQTYTVKTTRVAGGCEFVFDQNVELVTNGDYQSIKEFKDALHSVNRVELQVQRLDFFDDSGNRFDVENRIRGMELWVNGQHMLNVDQVRSLPTTVTLSGDALATIKKAVKARTNVTLHVVARVTVLDAMVPTGVRCEYESQPTYIVSTSEI